MVEMRKRILLFAISFGLLAALIYFSDPSKILETLLEVNLWLIPVGISLWFIGTLVRTARWRYFLGKIDIHTPFLPLLKIYISGMFISNLAPAKSGDPVRSALLKKSQGESFSRSVSSIFLGRALDVICLIFLSILSLSTLTFSLRISIWWLYLAISIYIALAVAGGYVLFSKERTKKVFGKLVSIFSFIPKIGELEEKVEYFSERLTESLKAYRSKTILASGFLLTLVIWLLNGLIPLAGFYAIGVEMSYVVVIAVMSTGILISFLTALPGSIGSGEIISVALYLSFVTIPVSSVTSVMILNRLLNFWMYAIVGAVLLTTVESKVGIMDFTES